jgi:predicted restriction endonuclease
MAQRRMFSLKIIDTDLFLDMPITARLLYYDLSMRAQDKGVTNNLHAICKTIGSSIKDINILKERGYLKQLSENEYEIVHWYENNAIGETAKKRITYKYRKWRESVLMRDNYTCQNCGVKEEIMNVHHIKSFSEHKDLRYDIDNGITLCEKCHKKLHKGG